MITGSLLTLQKSGGACTVRATKFASCALYAVPRVRIQSEVYKVKYTVVTKYTLQGYAYDCTRKKKEVYLGLNFLEGSWICILKGLCFSHYVIFIFD